MEQRKYNFFTREPKLARKIMQKALLQANRALKNGEVPIGALIIDSDGQILAKGYNKVEKNKCQLAHAEALAIKKACKKIGNWRLDNYWIFVTLEPCLMCFGIIKLSRLKGVVFGAKSNLFGIGLNYNELPNFYKKDLKIIGGVLEKECADVLKKFFKKSREKKKEER